MTPEERDRALGQTTLIVAGWLALLVCLGILIGPGVWFPLVMYVLGIAAGWLVTWMWCQGVDEAKQEKLVRTFWITLAWGTFCLAWFYVAVAQILPFWLIALLPWVPFFYTLLTVSRVWRSKS